MEDVNLILESVKFMMLGMTVVFTFLFLLIVVVNIQAKLIKKFFPEKTPVVSNSSGPSNEPHHVAAIVAAISEFRKR